MKAKKTKLTAATLSAFLALGASALTNAGGKNEGAQTGGDKSNSSVKGGKKFKRVHRRHRRHGKRHHKKGSSSGSSGTSQPSTPPK
jgi:hypothetical protein